MFNIVKVNNFDGLFELMPVVNNDNRGQFTKIFNSEFFERNNLNSTWHEQYYSVSHKNVLRGMHFQIPPYDHFKLVYCTFGSILDVVLDIRINSRTFGQFVVFNLTNQIGNILYIPPGFAHGFLTLSDSATVVYNVSSVYNSDSDTGIKWNSFGYKWPIDNPVLSSRDDRFMDFLNFTSPFS